MRINTQNLDTSMKTISSVSQSNVEQKSVEPIQQITDILKQDQQQETGARKVTKEDIEKAIDSIGEFLNLDHKQSKFVLHEGLNKYFVRLVNSETEEVIKEIPPEKLLDAFYEMKKLAGMIIDEKI
jgi:flagellar protein FlaG